MGHDFAPNLAPNVTFSDFVTLRGSRVPKGYPKAPPGAKKIPTCIKKTQKCNEKDNFEYEDWMTFLDLLKTPAKH